MVEGVAGGGRVRICRSAVGRTNCQLLSSRAHRRAVARPVYTRPAYLVFARLNLTALLAVLAVLDLIVDRWLTRIFLPASSVVRPGPRALMFAGSFLSYLGGALALLLFATCFLGLIRRRELYPRSLRMVASILAVFFVVLFVFAVSTYPGSVRLYVQLRTSQAFLAWMTSLAIWYGGLAIRTKLGVTLFMLPSILHTLALFLGEAAAFRATALPGQLVRVGELIAFLAAGAAPFLLLRAPASGAGVKLGWVAGAVAATLVGVAAAIKFDLVQLLALYGLRLELPPLGVSGGWAYLLLFALAVFGAVTVILPGLRGDGGERLIAYGVIMVVTAGYQIASPQDLAISVAGLLAIAVGAGRQGQGAGEAVVAQKTARPLPA
jgi:hypothetical protein